MNSSPPKTDAVAQTAKRDEVDAEAAAATQAQLGKKNKGYFQTALAGETGGFGGNTALR